MPVSDRQELIEGWEQEKLTKASVFVAGAGGLGGEIAEGLVRKVLENYILQTTTK